MQEITRRQRPPLETQSLQDAVYARLREMIEAGELQQLAADSGISLRSLAEEFGVSTMPVREAVRRLEAEGLVAFSRSEGIQVTALSPLSFLEVSDIRVRLELLAMERALPRIDDAVIQRANLFLNEMEVLRSAEAWRQANHNFHMALYAPGDYPRLLAMIENLWTMVEPYLRIYTSNISHLAGAQSDHRALLESIVARDSEAALSIVERHIRRSERLVLDELKSLERKQ